MGPSIAFVGIDLMEGGGMYGVDLYRRVGLACHREGLSRREAARRFGIDRKMVAKMLAFSVPPGYRRSGPPRRPKLDPFTGAYSRIGVPPRAGARIPPVPPRASVSEQASIAD